jgi:hypothetical protein
MVGLRALPPAGGSLVAPRAMDAHRALLPLVHGRPDTLSVATAFGGGGFANARFFWL